MLRPSPDTLKLGTTVVLMGGACLIGWVGLAAAFARGFGTDLIGVGLGNLLLTAIVGLLTWVLCDQAPQRQPVDA